MLSYFEIQSDNCWFTDGKLLSQLHRWQRVRFMTHATVMRTSGEFWWVIGDSWKEYGWAPKKTFLFRVHVLFSVYVFLVVPGFGFFLGMGAGGCWQGGLKGDVQGHLFKANGAQKMLLQKASNQLHSEGGQPTVLSYCPQCCTNSPTEWKYWGGRDKRRLCSHKHFPVFNDHIEHILHLQWLVI